MCMWFGYNPWINFYHFFQFVNFVIFWPQMVWKCIDSGYLVITTPYTISYLRLCNFAHLLTMVWRCACGLDLILQLNFVTFCHFSQVRHQLDLSSIYFGFVVHRLICHSLIIYCAMSFCKLLGSKIIHILVYIWSINSWNSLIILLCKCVYLLPEWATKDNCNDRRNHNHHRWKWVISSEISEESPSRIPRLCWK